MAVYKVSDLYDRIQELILGNYEYVAITVIAADDEYPESINFEALEEAHIGVDLESIEATELPKGYARPHLWQSVPKE